jgi:deoxycytidylate deaminase
MLINSGIKRIVYRLSYPDANSLEMLKEAGVEVDWRKPEIKSTRDVELIYCDGF